MKFGKTSKRVIAFVLSIMLLMSTIVVHDERWGLTKAIAASDNPTFPTTYDSASAVNYATILGRATDYGIVAENFEQTKHMETTFAVNNFKNTSGTESTIDLIPSGSTAQFLIGGYDTTSSTKINIGGDVPGTMNIEAMPSVLKNFDGKKGDYLFIQTSSKVLVTENDKTKDNITSMKNNVYENSVELEKKAKNAQYAINYNDFFTDGKLDLTDKRFVNRVVYINVDQNLLNYMKVSGALSIIKDSSTIVVFNISDDSDITDERIKINKYSVSIDNGTSQLFSDIYSGGPASIVTDRELCQKIIYNFRTTKNIGLDNTSGLFIAPKSSLVEVDGTDAGWIVAENFRNTVSEWHFIYNGGNQEVQKDGEGQMHFAARKAVTDQYNGKNTVENKSVFVEKNTFTFNFIETTNGTEKLIDQVTNFATNTIKFPTLTFLTDKVENKTASAKVSGNFYEFVEGGSTAFKNGLKNNPGKIRVVVEGHRSDWSTDGVITLTSDNGNYVKHSIEKNNLYDYDFSCYFTGTEFMETFQITNPDSYHYFTAESNKNEAGEDVYTITRVGYEVVDYYYCNEWGNDFINVLKTNPENVSVKIEYTDNKYYGPGNQNNGNIGILVNNEMKGTRNTTHGTHTITLTGNEIIGMLGGTSQDAINKFEIGFYNGVVPGKITYQIITRNENNQASNYIPSGGQKTYTYRITEENPGGVDMPGVLNSTGSIDITLNVKSVDGVLKYTVSSVTKLGDKNNTTYKTNNNVDMSGIEFTLGAFFNLKNGAFEFEKINGAEETLGGARIKLERTDGNKKLYSYGYNDVRNITATQGGTAVGNMSEARQVNPQGVGNYDFFYFNSSATDKTVISNLPAGSYKLSEDIDNSESTVSDYYEKAEDINFTVDENGVVTIKGETEEEDYITTGIYMMDLRKVEIIISKLKEDKQTRLEGAKLQIYDYFTNEKVGDPIDTKKDKDETREIVEGTYILKEETTPPEYITAEPITFYVDSEGQVYEIGGEEWKLLTDNKIVMIDEKEVTEVGYIDLTKTIKGDVTDEDLKGLAFSVKKGNEELYSLTLGKDFQDDDKDGVWKLKNKLPIYEFGTDFTVTETLTTLNGFDVTVSYKIGTGTGDNTTFAQDAEKKTSAFEVKKNETTSVAYENNYKFKPVSTKIAAEKSLSGRNLAANEFSFTISNKDGVLTTIKNDANGKVDFGSFDYKQPGTFVYTIEEVKGTEGTIAYSSDVYVVTVEVTHVTEGTEAGLSLSKTVTKNGNEYTGDIIFTNTYVPETVTVTATKKWVDAEGEELKTIPENAKVTFTLKADGVATNKTIELDGTTDSNGEATAWIANFGALPKYDGENEIVYTIEETVGFDGFTNQNTNGVANGGTITNKQDVKSLTVKKVWDDKDNQDGKRPENIVMTLSNDTDSEKIDVTLNAANNWEATLDVPTHKNGVEVNYTWSEGTMPEGYSQNGNPVVDSTGKITTFTNTYDTEKTSATIVKVWDDDNDRDGLRPKELAVVLLADGVETSYVATLSDSNKWTYTISDLDAKNGGKTIVYTWAEPEVTGYSAEDPVVNDKTTTITNKHEIEKVTVSATKAWKNADGSTTAPAGANVVFTLYANGEATDNTVTLDGTIDDKGETAVWTASFANLPANNAGQAITYTVVETTGFAGYSADKESVSDKGTITNTRDKGKIVLTKTIEGDITVEELEGQLYFVIESAEKDGEKTLYLKQDGTLTTDIEEAKLYLDKDKTDGTGKYIIEIDAVPTGDYTVTEYDYDENGYGVEVSYALGADATDKDFVKDEDASVGISVSKGETTTSNFKDDYTRDKGSIVLTKTIEGELNEAEIAGQLYFLIKSNDKENTYLNKNGVEVQSIEDAKITLKDIAPVDGKYIITINDVPTGNYTVTEYDYDENGYGVEVSYALGADAADKDFVIDEDASVAIDVSKDTTTTINFKDDYTRDKGTLVLTKTIEGDLTAAEIAGELYFIIESKDEAGKYLLTDGSLTESKDDAKITLKDIIPVDGKYIITINNVPTGDFIVTEYDYNENGYGVEVSYAIGADATDEDFVVDADASVEVGVSKDTATTLNFKDDYTDETVYISIKVKKVWDDENDKYGKRPESITVNLSNGVKPVDNVTLSDDNNWEAEIGNLPKYKEDGVTEYVYTWTEATNALPEGYSLKSMETVEGVTTITNTYAPEKVSSTIIKVWNDNDDLYNNRPESITVTLYKNSKKESNKVETVTLNASNGWQATVSNLDKYSSGTNEIEYLWYEDNQTDGYSMTSKATVNSLTSITNSIDTITISATKEWVDCDGNKLKTAPEAQVTFVLYANGKEFRTVVLDGTTDSNGEKSPWIAEFSKLPVYMNGNVVTYTVDEVSEFDGFEKTNEAPVLYVKDVEEGITIKNRELVTEMTVKKVWDDSNNQDGKRPESIVMTLSNGTASENRTVTLNAANNWEETIDKLPTHKNGTKLTYSWSEGEMPSGYSQTGKVTEGTVTAFTNSYTPGKVSASVEKVWEDDNNRDNIRPASVTVKLLADGVETGKSVTLSEANSWTDTITDLPEKNEGKTIVYSWAEVVPDGYSASYSKKNDTTTTVTNTHEIATVDISATKAWKNADGTTTAPNGANVTFTLCANGSETNNKITLDGTETEPWTASFTNLPKNEAGKAIEYTVKETTGYTGYTADKESVENGGTITNIQDTGSLVITKTLSGDVTPEEENGLLTFTIKNQEGLYLDKDGKLNKDEVILTLKDFEASADKKTYTLRFTGDKKLATDTYTVEETNSAIPGYNEKVTYTLNKEDSKEGKKVEVKIDKDAENTLVIDDLYSDKVGTIVLTKTIEGDITAEEIAGDLTFLIESKDSAGKYLKTDGTLTDKADEAKITLEGIVPDKDGKYVIEIKNAPEGKYSVTETDYTCDGTAVVVTYSLNGADEVTSDTAAIEVKDGKTTTVDFKDDYTKDTGSLVITKKLSGDLTEEEKAGGITFTIMNSDGKFLDKDGNLKELEKDAKITLAAFTPSEDGKTYTLSFTGDKKLATDTYTVTETNASITGYTEKISYQLNGAASVETEANKGIEVVVEKDDNDVLVIDDNYSRDKGTIVLTKTIKGHLTPAEKAGELSFLIECANEEGKYLKTDGTITDNADDAKITLQGIEPDSNGKYTITITNVPTDDYIVTEQTYTSDGYAVKVSYQLNGADAVTSDNAAIGVEKGKTTTVDFENDYTKDTGELIITKQLSGLVTPEEEAGGITFTITNEAGEFLDADGKLNEKEVVLTLANFEKGSTVDGVTTYTLSFTGDKKLSTDTYTVTETNSSIDGYTESVSYELNGTKLTTTGSKKPIEVKVEKNDTDVLVIDDAYVRDKGELTITKQLSGLVTPEEEAGGITFTITNEAGEFLDADGKLNKDKVELTLANFEKGSTEDGVTTYTLSFTGDKKLATDTYTVTETNSSIDGYTESVSYKLNNTDLTTTGSQKPIEVKVEKNDTDKLIIADAYTPDSSLTVIVTEENSGKPVPDAEVEITYPDGTKETKTTDKDGKITEENIPSGEYTVEVKKVPEGYDVKTGEKDTVNVPKGGEGKHEAVIYTEKGGLDITVTEEDTGDAVPNAEVTIVKVNEDGSETPVTNKEGGTTFTTDENGKVTELTEKDEYDNYKLEPGKYKATVTKVPDGFKVTKGEVTEGTVVKNDVTHLEAEIIPVSELVVIVTEEHSGRPVPDAEVQISKKNPDGTTTVVKTEDGKDVFTTDENGKINEKEIPAGEYVVEVKKVPEGYDVRTGEKDTVVVPRDSVGKHEAVIYTEKGGLDVTVTEKKSGDVVPDAEVEIFKINPDGSETLIKTKDGKEVFTTDENGKIIELTEKDEYDNYILEPGEYVARVKKVPEGYDIEEGEETKGTVVKNEITHLKAVISTTTGGLDIQVVEEGDEERPVPGAKVEVITPDGEKLILITDEDGYIRKFSEKDDDGDYTAKTGEYKITVIEVPEGYKVTVGETKIEVVEKGRLKFHQAKIQKTSSNNEERTPSPKTGDDNHLLMLMLLAAVSMAGMIVFRKKENEN